MVIDGRDTYALTGGSVADPVSGLAGYRIRQAPTVANAMGCLARLLVGNPAVGPKSVRRDAGPLIGDAAVIPNAVRRLTRDLVCQSSTHDFIVASSADRATISASRDSDAARPPHEARGCVIPP